MVRNAGILVAVAAVGMMLFSFGAMLWMDVPLLVLGLGLIAWSYWDERRAKRAS